jgi:hypothetical protein
MRAILFYNLPAKCFLVIGRAAAYIHAKHRVKVLGESMGNVHVCDLRTNATHIGLAKTTHIRHK